MNVKEIKKEMNNFEKDYAKFCDYLVDNCNEKEMKFIKSKGVNYVSDLFWKYKKNENILNRIYCDMVNY